MSFVSDLVDSIVEMPGHFADVATQGPVEGLLVLMGAILVIVPSAALGYLTLGVVLDLLLPDAPEISHP